MTQHRHEDMIYPKNRTWEHDNINICVFLEVESNEKKLII